MVVERETVVADVVVEEAKEFQTAADFHQSLAAEKPFHRKFLLCLYSHIFSSEMLHFDLKESHFHLFLLYILFLFSLASSFLLLFDYFFFLKFFFFLFFFFFFFKIFFWGGSFFE